MPAAIHFADLPQAQTVNRRLIEAFEREKDAPDVRRTHMFEGRYENTYVPLARLPELAPVSTFALRKAEQLLHRRGLRQGFWFNAMPPGSRTTLHSHEETDELLSAVYYVQCEKNSGRLLLHDGEAQIAVTPRSGLLVLFPPDLPHEVEQNASAAMRLSVAFNFGPPNSVT
jgi:hypothetical protein